MAPRTEAQQGNGPGDEAQGSTRSSIDASATAAADVQSANDARLLVGRVLSHYRLEERLGEVSIRRSGWAAWLGVFLFTVLTISREGMETSLMLLQVRSPRLLSGALLGLAAAVAMAWAWGQFGHLINVKRFFQVTGIFLLLFMTQVAIFTFHEFAEAGVLPNSEALHAATEKFSPDGLYGKWFSVVMVGLCALWLVGAWVIDRLRTPQPQVAAFSKLKESH